MSIATVSKVLNGKGRISDSTKKRVMDVVERHSYEPSAIASALAGKNTHTIGFVLPDVNNPYFSEIVRGAEDEAFARGYSVLICNTDHNPDKERAYIKTLRQKQMDGLVVATGSLTADVIEGLYEDNVRVVLLAREIAGVKIGTVTVDNYQGGYLAGKHLLALEHRVIGVIAEPLSIGSSRDRLHGFETAVREQGGQILMTEDTGFGISNGHRVAKKLLQEKSVTAIFAANDQLAVGAMRACRELGKLIPEDISIVGFDDTIFARIVTPALTTIAQPMYSLGQQTLRLLIEAIESGQQPTETSVLPLELVIRESTAKCRGTQLG